MLSWPDSLAALESTVLAPVLLGSQRNRRGLLRVRIYFFCWKEGKANPLPHISVPNPVGSEYEVSGLMLEKKGEQAQESWIQGAGGLSRSHWSSAKEWPQPTSSCWGLAGTGMALSHAAESPCLSAGSFSA